MPKYEERNKYSDTERTEDSKKLNSNRPIPRHIIIKMAKVKDKEKILKAAREKDLVQLIFSTETLQARVSDKTYSSPERK